MPHGRVPQRSDHTCIPQMSKDGMNAKTQHHVVCLQDAGKGEWARLRILQMSRHMIEECRESKDLDKRSIAVRLPPLA